MNLPPFIISEFSAHNFDEKPIFGQKINFGDFHNIPQCCLFSYSDDELQFVSVSANESFEILEVPIKDALALLGEEAYELHSERWYKVRKQISTENKTHYPWLYVNSEGEVALMDGRHRLIAMMMFKNMEFAPVQVDPLMSKQIKDYFGYDF